MNDKLLEKFSCECALLDVEKKVSVPSSDAATPSLKQTVLPFVSAGYQQITQSALDTAILVIIGRLYRHNVSNREF